MSEEPKFKVGDKVVMQSGHYGTPSIKQIERITPSGQIILKGSKTRFKQDGRQFGGDSWNRWKIKLSTQQDYDKIEHENLAYQISKTAFKALTLPQLRELKTLLDRFESEGAK